MSNVKESGVAGVLNFKYDSSSPMAPKAQRDLAITMTSRFINLDTWKTYTDPELAQEFGLSKRTIQRILVKNGARFSPAYESKHGREAFPKTFSKWDWQYAGQTLPYLQKLEDRGLVPETVAIEEHEDGAVSAYMRRVNGFDLDSIPHKYTKYFHTVNFAKKTAELFQGFFDLGYYHNDPHSRNFMYDVEQKKVVAVDLLDSVQTNKGNIPLTKYVYDYAWLLASVLTGINEVRSRADGLRIEGRLGKYIGEKDETEFKRKAKKIKIGSKKYQDLVEEYSAILVTRQLETRGIGLNLNQVVRGFVLRALNPPTIPANFDEILNLQS
ncbi:MAG: hypothetical protein Q7K54_05910 [Candidatus Parcubacteria bacterium]|nr:hypothetical protein [Candidatus Parcubacteria bacterium]